jgi:hypothetical protein
MAEEVWNEEDIMQKLRDDAEDDHRNYIYPIQAQSILDLLKKKDETIDLLIEQKISMVKEIDKITVKVNALIKKAGISDESQDQTPSTQRSPQSDH